MANNFEIIIKRTNLASLFVPNILFANKKI